MSKSRDNLLKKQRMLYLKSLEILLLTYFTKGCS